MLPQDLSRQLEGQGNNTGQVEPTGSLPISLTDGVSFPDRA